MTDKLIRFKGAVYQLSDESPADLFISQADAITLPDAEIYILLSKSRVNDHTVILDDLSVVPARQGFGSKFMQEFVALADKLGVILKLRVANESDDWQEYDDEDEDAPPTEADLIDWYGRFGFDVVSASGDTVMQRVPKIGGDMTHKQIRFKGAVYRSASTASDVNLGHRWRKSEIGSAFLDLLNTFSGGDNLRFAALQSLVREFDRRAGEGDDVAYRALLPIVQVSRLIDIGVRELERANPRGRRDT